MTPERLEAIAFPHQPGSYDTLYCGHCGERWPCDVSELVGEIRRLQGIERAVAEAWEHTTAVVRETSDHTDRRRRTGHGKGE